MNPNLFAPREPVPAGRVVRIPVRSVLLAGNRLGDPANRVLPVWLPPDFDPARRYPVVHYLVGFGGAGEVKLGWRTWTPNLAARLDRLYAQGDLPPVLVAFPDCSTRLGGSQYIDSAVCGPYARHLVEELVPLVDAELPTLPRREHRAVVGKSSGGFGALVHGMLHPETWGAVACHSGDAGFELCFGSPMPRTLDTIARYGSVEGFLRAFFDKPKHGVEDLHAMMHLAMAACFDPQPELEPPFALPADLRTGAMVPERWQRWLAWDPVRLVPRHAEALRSLRMLFVDCGRWDQYHLHYGARQLVAALRAAGVEHRYEEFEDDHTDVDYRLDVSLPLVGRAIL